jgi:membrane protease YdiL (CAAX protease family)
MTGHDPSSGAPSTEPEASAPTVAGADRTIGASQTDARRLVVDPAVSAPRVGGGISLIVAFIGLVGASLGAGWFGLESRLALSPGGLWGGALTLIAATLTVVGLVLLVGGLGYYVLAPAFGSPQAAWRGVGSHRLVIATTGLIVLLANAGPVAYVSIAGPGGLCSIPGFLTAALSVDLVLLAITYLRFIRPGVMTVADLGLGLDVSRLGRLVGIGLVLGVAVLVMSALVQSALQATGVRQTQMAGLSCIRGFPPGGFLAVVLAGGVLAPIAEELYFRGYVFRTYFQSRGPWVAYGATSLLFATLHLNLPALLPILVLSLLLCLAYRKTGSIIPSIVGHALNNTAAFCILYFTNAPL